MARIKRTTGIPRSFLKTVEKPAALTSDGTTDETKGPSGIMVNAEGEFVIAEPDKASWEQFQAKTKSSAAAQKAAAMGDKELQDKGLECSIDKRIFIDPMKTPCCEKTYCNDCITNALIESDFTCPGCQTDGVLIDDLKPDTETSAKIKTYLEEKTAAKKEKERSKSPSIKDETETATLDVKKENGTPTAARESPSAVKSPKASTTSPTIKPAVNSEAPASKKRPADELLENPKIPKGPKAMQQQEAQKAMMQQQAMMNGMPAMPGFPNMPFDMSQQFGNGFMPMNNMGMMNNFMPNMMGMPMNPMMGMNNFGFPGMNGMGFGMGGFQGGMGMMNGGFNGNVNGGFANANGGGGLQATGFVEPAQGDGDGDAYFRKPVNPHRHQGRQRKARPSDYREL
jgi:protein MPE1